MSRAPISGKETLRTFIGRIRAGRELQGKYCGKLTLGSLQCQLQSTKDKKLSQTSRAGCRSSEFNLRRIDGPYPTACLRRVGVRLYRTEMDCVRPLDVAAFIRGCHPDVVAFPNVQKTRPGRPRARTHCSAPFEDNAGPGGLLPGEIPGILNICHYMCCEPIVRCPVDSYAASLSILQQASIRL